VSVALKEQFAGWGNGVNAAGALPSEELEDVQCKIRIAEVDGRRLLTDSLGLLDHLKARAGPVVAQDWQPIDTERLGARVLRLNTSAKRWLNLDLKLTDPTKAATTEAADKRRAGSEGQARERYALLASVLTKLRSPSAELDGHEEQPPNRPNQPLGKPRSTPRAKEIALHALLARLSDSVYTTMQKGQWLDLKSTDNAQRELVEVLVFRSSGTGTWKKPQWALSRTDGRAYGDFAALVFKGTEVLSEWLVDLAFATGEIPSRRGLKLHAGISANLMDNIAAVEDALSLVGSDLPLYFCGHSLGGAYAMCSYYMVAPALSARVERVVGFGAPLVTGANLGALEVVQHAQRRFLTYVAGHDIVPRSLYRGNAEKVAQLARSMGGKLPTTHLPEYEPVGEFRALPGAHICQHDELLLIQPGAPLTAHVDDHACRDSYARQLDLALR